MRRPIWFVPPRCRDLIIVLCAAAGCAAPGLTGDPPPPLDAGSDIPEGTLDGPPASSTFSFFVTSLGGLQSLSGSPIGFGGDLRYGETGPGAGLRGADKICSALAETSQPGAGKKTWRAFLSVAAGDAGTSVNAIERVGEGPWYDRFGRLLAPDRAGLTSVRPTGGEAAIQSDLPNEYGVPNHAPDATGPIDNHDVLTGSGTNGMLFSPTSTCGDWTTNAGTVEEGRPHAGHSWPRSATDTKEGWISAHDAEGCAPGVNLMEGSHVGARTVGAGGGYGGIYCFALEH